MVFDAHKNFGYATIVTAPLPALSGTSLVLSVGGGALMPAAPFNATVFPPGTGPLLSNAEIVRVTNVIGDTLTIVRAQEGTTAKAIVAGWQFANTITTKVVTDIEAALNALPQSAIQSISAGTQVGSASQIVFANSNGLSFGMSGSSQITASYTVPSTAGLISGINLSAGTLSSNRSGLSFSDSNGVSFGLNTNGAITASANLSHSNLLGLDEDAHPRVTNSLSTSLLVGGEITINADPTKFDIAAGVGIIIDNHTNPENPTRTIVSWAAKTAVIDPYIATSDTSAIAIDVNGDVFIVVDTLDEEQRRDYISIGSTSHPGRIEIESADIYPVWEIDAPNQLQDFLLNFGAFNIDGNEYDPVTGMTIMRTAGKSFVAGGNYSVTAKSPNVCVTLTENPVAELYYYHQSTPGVWVNDTTAVAAVDPNYYDSGSGLVAVTTGKWTIQTIFFYAPWGYTDMQYGQVEYDSLVDAQAALQAAIAVNPWIGLWDTFRAWLIIQEGCTDITDPATSLFVSAGKLGLVSVASGGGAGGEVNTMENHGNAGVGVFFQKNGVKFEMKNIAPGSPRISVSNDTTGTNVRIDVVESALAHSNLSGLAGYDHPQYFATSNLSQVFNISAGTASNSLGSVVFSNSNGMSFGLDGSTITAAHNGITSQSVQTQSNVQGILAGMQIGRTGVVVFSNSNGISFGMSGSSRITASYTVPGATEFSNSNNVTFGINGSTVTASVTISQTVQTQSNVQGIVAGTQSGRTGDVVFSNSNGITFGMSNSSVVTASYTVPSTAGLLSAVNLSAGTTSQNLSAITFGNGNGVSFGLNGSVVTASVGAGGAPGSLSAGTASMALGQVILSNSNGISFGLNGSTVTASYTVPSTAGHLSAINLSAGTTSQNLSALTFSNLNGVSFGLNGSVVTASVNPGGGGGAAISAGANSQSTGTVNFANSNGITFGLSNNGTMTASHNGLTVQSNQQMTAFAASNTTQSSSGTFNASSLVFAGAGIASVGVTNGSVVVSVPAGAPSPVNFSAGAASGNLGSVVFSNLNGVSFGLNGSTITASVGAAGGGITLSGFHPYSNIEMIAQSIATGSFNINPMDPPSFQFDRVIMPINFLNTSNSSGSQTISVFMGVYTRNVSTLSLVGSASVSYGITNSGTVGNYSLVSAMRNLSIPWTSTFGASNYWVGMGIRTTSGGANASFSNFVLTQMNTNFIAPFNAVPNNTFQMTLGQGYYTATTSAAPGSIAFSHIAGSASINRRPYVYHFASGTA